MNRDPLSGFTEIEQKNIYPRILNYLESDEELVDDSYKMEAVINICINNARINFWQRMVSRLTINETEAAKNAQKVASYRKEINGLAKEINDIAKENAISSKNKKNGVKNKNAFTERQKAMRSLKLEDVEVDFYDQKKAFGMQRAANISFKAAYSNLDDLGELLAEALEESARRVKELEETVDKVEEENRLLHKEIDKRKSGDK